MHNCRLTKSGLFVRHDDGVGYLVYSPFTGLFFAVQDAEGDSFLDWLNLKDIADPPIEYVKALGPGWKIPLQDAEYPEQHLLPSRAKWKIIAPKAPILINWFLTGNCGLACRYCYAQDLMHDNCKEPTSTDIARIASAILNCSPLAVVLTGGDPLLSPHLESALEHLQGKCGIILDTSGYSLQKKHVDLFCKYNVFVRVSLDSEIPKVNEFVRPLSNKSKGKTKISSSEAAIAAINDCLDNGVKVGVQTVVTRYNRSDLEFLGDKLFRLGISNWRLMQVARSSERLEAYNDLRGDEKGRRRYFNHIQKQLRIKHKNWWNQGMAVQLTDNKTPNAVVLVAPDGKFYTESNIQPGKDLLYDPATEQHCSIFEKVATHAHAERYLNIHRS